MVAPGEDSVVSEQYAGHLRNHYFDPCRYLLTYWSFNAINYTEVYSEPSQTFKMEFFFQKQLTAFKLNYFARGSILDVRPGFEYAFAIDNIVDILYTPNMLEKVLG